ncbi:MAG: isoprenyl transferase [Thermodesulfobacteriota bacterium]|nr:isoprenyl transferase [Thermodesulfobacteriota bacterium]
MNFNSDILPRHVAVIMDGNGRWAKKKMMNRIRGHEKGTDTVRAIVNACCEIGIEYLTLYAFSTENWDRPQTEVSALMRLLKKFSISERAEFIEKNIRLDVIGQKERLPEDVRTELDITMDKTRHNTRLAVNLALSYGGREEITRAAVLLAKDIASGRLMPEKICEKDLSGHLYTKGMPDPDILIRTSGEMRLSNFLLWQAAYAEIFFTDTLWPDFTKNEFIDILREYQTRDRRFGRILCSSNDG